MTFFKGWRTIAFNVIAGIPLVLEAAVHIASLPEVAAVLPRDWLPWYSLALVLANMGLRWITTTPIGRKE
jgi:hypothetical protein